MIFASVFIIQGFDMAVLYSQERNIKVSIEICHNQNYDVLENRTDYENWIPFSFNLNTPTLNRNINEDSTFTLFEIKNFIKNSKELCITKNKKIDFCTLEAYFEMIVNPICEDDELEIVLWLNVGTITNGEHYGYKEGCLFYTSIDKYKRFIEELESELYNDIWTYSHC